MGFNEPTKLQPEIFTFTHSLTPMSNEINNPDKLPKVAIIGSGNLGVAIAKGLATSIGAESIWLCRRHLYKIESMAKDGFKLTKDTVLAASGIAFFLRYIRAATQGGIELGFEAEEALTMATATAKGAASLLMVQGSHPESEIDKVTTPKGFTIAGLNEMEYQGLSSAVIQGLKKSFDKISSIGDS